jgi:cytochrome c oxidase subunit II
VGTSDRALAPRRESLRVTGRGVAVVGLAALVAGCDGKQSSLHPESHASHVIANLFWWMMGIAWGGLALVVALLLLAWKRRNRRGIGSDDKGPKAGERAGWFVVVGAGIVMPIGLIAALFFVSDIFVIKATEAPAANATTLTVLVIGHQWWWEVRYPGTNAVTANEIHIPARTPVRLEVRTADVIHSVWVPELNRTIDTIPGRTNVIELDAKKAGTFRGQCDEFCGLQHAHMSFLVIAQPQAAFRRWLVKESRPATVPATAAARRGEQAFVGGSCASCHSIRGTDARGYVGPDLTHVAGRRTLAAVTIDNRPDLLAHWITDAQDVKPGNQMPDLKIGGKRLHDLVTYLDGLE